MKSLMRHERPCIICKKYTYKKKNGISSYICFSCNKCLKEVNKIIDNLDLEVCCHGINIRELKSKLIDLSSQKEKAKEDK